MVRLFFSDIFLVFVLLLAIFVSQEQLNQILKARPVNVRLTPPPVAFIERMTFGYNDMIADSLWLRTIQNMDECRLMGMETGDFSPELRPQKDFSDPHQKLDPNVMKALALHTKRKGMCSRGWAFQMMDGATRLAPRFAMIYELGATGLSVLLADFEGASVLFNRGVKNVPKDWSIEYRAAYHFLFAVKDFSRAAELLKLAGENGAPFWVGSLAARLYTQSGQAQLALPLLVDVYEKSENPVARKELSQRISALKKIIQEQKTHEE